MNETIGSRIHFYRKARGLTQEELAEKLGVSSQAVSKWENDVSCPDISVLPKLCHVLGITSDELLSGRAQGVVMTMPEDRRTLEELTLRIYVLSADGDRVKVNLPMTLVKACMEMGLDVSTGVSDSVMKQVDMGKILALVEKGVIGKLVEVESKDGDKVEVVVE